MRRSVFTIVAAALVIAPRPGQAETATAVSRFSRAELEGTSPAKVLARGFIGSGVSDRLLVRLKFTETPFVVDGGNSWSYVVRYHLTVGGVAGAQRQLTLFRGVDREVIESADAVGPIAATMTQLVVDGTDSPDRLAVPQAIALTAEVSSTRTSVFVPTAKPVLVLGSGTPPTITWPEVPGAEDYSLEVAFVDQREASTPADPFAARLPVRIRTVARAHPVDGHRSAGTVYYRARAVGRHPGGGDRFGPWSSVLSVAVPADGGPSGFQRDMNWSLRLSYDASGPGQSTLTYFDGSLRHRQVQATAPDKAERTIAETKYDFEGRPAVDFLATPTSGRVLSYVGGFNRAVDGSVYGPEHFDRDAVVAAASSIGAGKYFSAQSGASGPLADMVPDAEGYPFSVAEHTRDGSRRLRAMSGFGARLRLGSGHDTQYVYGDASESQLRRLFGSALGRAADFQRTVTADPNRAFEVSYRDTHDRIIAQGLIGDPPVNLADIADAPVAESLEVRIDGGNRVDPAAGRSILSYRIGNAVNTAYFFTYAVNGVEYQADPGDVRFPPLCESCRYRVRIRILHPNGARVPLIVGATAASDPGCAGSSGTSAPTEIDQIVGNPTPPVCAAGLDDTRSFAVPPVRFCAKLSDPGEYEVQKELEFIDGDINARIDSYVAGPGYFTPASYRRPVDPRTCGDACVTHCAEATGINPSTNSSDPTFVACVDQCMSAGWTVQRTEEAKCASLEGALVADLTPGGRHYRSGGSNTIADHPEGCQVAVCRQMKLSETYGSDMGRVQTYQEALCRGFLNPLGQPIDSVGPPAPSGCAASPMLDPFFVNSGPGQTLRAAAIDKMTRYSDSVAGWPGPRLSAWQFAADPVTHQNAMGFTLDDQWRVFRSLYLGVKQGFVVKATEGPPPLMGCPYFDDPQAHVPRPEVPTTVEAVSTAIDQVSAERCQALCAARVPQWLLELRTKCADTLEGLGQVRAGLAQYCQFTCGSDNPLALLTKEAIAANAPGLAAAEAALRGCHLVDIAVDDPYTRTTVCRERCCTSEGPTACASTLIKVLRERLPAPTGTSRTLYDTQAGSDLHSKCLDWVDHLRGQIGVSELLSKDEARKCSVVLVAPDGTVVPPKEVEIVGTPDTAGQGAVSNHGALPFTGLYVDINWQGHLVRGAIYSNCLAKWHEPLEEKLCHDRVTVNGQAFAACAGASGGSSERSRGATEQKPLVLDGRPVPLCGRTATRRAGDKPENRGEACPTCLDELRALLQGRTPGDLERAGGRVGACFVAAKVNARANTFELIQTPAPGTDRTCRLRFLGPDAHEFPLVGIQRFGQMTQDVLLPAGLPPVDQGAHYLGASVTIVTLSGPKVVYLYSDCDFKTSTVCGGADCEVLTKSPPCLDDIIKRLHTPSRDAAASRQGTRGRPVSSSVSCVSGLRTSGDVATAQVVGPPPRTCRFVILGPRGERRTMATLTGSGTLHWAPADGGAPSLPGWIFTGYVFDVENRRSKERFRIYSDCAFAPVPDCSTFVTGVVYVPPTIPPSRRACEEAATEVADQAAQVARDAAAASFSNRFKTVHYNRCFGDRLSESFAYSAGSREYHYTLRYYDQADNLVQTVAPAGVSPLAPAQVAAYQIQGSATVDPAHRMATRFQYDSLNRLLEQTTPDTGKKRFIYDSADRLRFSQNAQQALDGTFAYSKYDGRNRVVETGLLHGVAEDVVRSRTDDPVFPGAPDGVRSDVVQNHFDTANAAPACASLAGRFLRGRVAAVVAATVLGATTLCYSYDAQGFVEAILRDVPGLGAKKVEYQYDRVGSRVLGVRYQAGAFDAFHHRYSYGRAGELKLVETSRDGVLWERDARYEYYEHGPLARMVLGSNSVQGLDYSYTIAGWPKGLNSGTLTPDRDPGGDGRTGSPNSQVARDVAGTSLEYFDGDFIPVGRSRGTLPATQDPHSRALLAGPGGAPQASSLATSSCDVVGVADGCGLYGGTVVRSVLGLEGLGGPARVTGFAYRYDRLYRLRESLSHQGLDPATNRWPASGTTGLWRTQIAYDGNGNVTTLERDAMANSVSTLTSTAMDRLAYRYAEDTQGRLIANRLQHVNDTAPVGAFSADLDDHGAYSGPDTATHNYAYDANGNPVRDRAAGITAIRWTPLSRVSAVEKGATTLEYVYDGNGLRFAKITKPSAAPESWEFEYFVRDELGRLLATYRQSARGSNTAPPVTPVLAELYLRGATTLGVIRVPGGTPAAPAGTLALVRGDKQYQVANHLGQVLATVSDRRTAVVGAGTTVDHYVAETLSSTDYDPFGAPSPGRFSETRAYRFGFSGLERDDELKGTGNSYYTEERLFDPRIGRWLSPDPVQLSAGSPYAGFSNNPLRFGDPRGQLDWDGIKDVAKNVATTAMDMHRDTARLLSGQAAVEAIQRNLDKAMDSYRTNGDVREAAGWVLGINGSLESLAEKDHRWEEGGASVEDRIRMGVGEVSGMNDVARAVTGATEFGEGLSWPERAMLFIEGGGKVLTIAATGAQAISPLVQPKVGVLGETAPKPSVKSPEGPPCPTGNSFEAGTLVLTPSGLEPIEKLRLGDEVLARDPESGRLGPAVVSATSDSERKEVAYLRLQRDQQPPQGIVTTPEHAFWIEGVGWLSAKQIKVGQSVASRDGGWLRVVLAETAPRSFRAFNLTVEGAQTYFVSRAEAWVHNCRETGSYTNRHESGKTYSGKGDRARSQVSGRRVEKETGDRHTATDWTPAPNEREAFKQESRRIDEHGGVESSSNYNRSESPGKKYRKEDGDP